MTATRAESGLLREELRSNAATLSANGLSYYMQCYYFSMKEQIRWVPFANVECPGCKAMHPQMMVRRDLLIDAIEKKKPLQMYCINSDAVWAIIVHDKLNLKKSLDDGLL